MSSTLKTGPDFVPAAEAHGVGDLVCDPPQRKGCLGFLRSRRSAGGLLLPGSDDLAYSPSKMPPSTMTGRHIPALVCRGSQLAGRLATPSREVAEFLARAARAHPPVRLLRNDAWFPQHQAAEAGARRPCKLFYAVVQATPPP